MRPATVRAIVLDVFARVMEHGELADHALHRALRAHKELHSTERRLVATALFAMIRLHRRHDFLLDQALMDARRSTTGQMATPELNKLRFAAALATALEESPESAVRMADLDFQLEPILARVKRGEAKWPDDPVARLAVEGSLPGWAAKRLLEEYGDEAPALAHALNARAPLTLRTNTLKITREELREKLAAEGIASEPGALSPWALLLESHHNVFGLAAGKEGLFEVQDEGSQLIALATQAAPGEHVLDACCGSGGKALALAAMMQNKGLVIAGDIAEARLEDLKPRARRAGAFNFRPVIAPEGPAGDKALKQYRGRAHVVLVDAPCSGSGAWRRHPDARWRMEESEIESYAARQKQILQRYAACVRPGGRLVYATCSLFKAENEAVADAFAAEATDFSSEPISNVPLAALDSAGRIKVLPHRQGTDGFFAAAFRQN